MSKLPVAVTSICRSPDTRLFKDEFDHLDLTQLRQVEWAESSTKGSVLWRGRPEFRNRIVERLRKMRDEYPRVFSLTDLPEWQPLHEPAREAADPEPVTTPTYLSLIRDELATR